MMVEERLTMKARFRFVHQIVNRSEAGFFIFQVKNMMQALRHSRRWFKFAYPNGEEIENEDGVKVEDDELWFPSYRFFTETDCEQWAKERGINMNIVFKSMERIDKTFNHVQTKALKINDRIWEKMIRYMSSPDEYKQENFAIFESWLANNFPDRANERFSKPILQSFKETAPGKPKLNGHQWGPPGDGRFFDARLEKVTIDEALELIGSVPIPNYRSLLEKVEETDKGLFFLICSYYMLNVTPEDQDKVRKIKTGIISDMSIGFRAPTMISVYEKDEDGRDTEKLLWQEFTNTKEAKAEMLEGSHVFLGAQYGARNRKDFGIPLDDEIIKKLAMEVRRELFTDYNMRGQNIDGQIKFSGSPRNPFGSHCSYRFKGGVDGYKRAWRLHFSQINGGALTPDASGPIRGTIRRIAMIAAAMDPKCDVVKAEGIEPRDGPKSPLEGTFPEKPSDYGLDKWLNPADEDVDPKTAKQFTCNDLNVIKRAAVAELKRRIKDREAEKEKSESETTEIILNEIRLLETEIENEINEIKPYPNEHACRLKDPDTFVRFRRQKRKHENKEYSAIIGFKEDGGSEDQAYRYPKDIWSVAEAKAHCKEHSGQTFEPAIEKFIDELTPAQFTDSKYLPEKIKDLEMAFYCQELQKIIEKEEKELDCSACAEKAKTARQIQKVLAWIGIQEAQDKNTIDKKTDLILLAKKLGTGIYQLKEPTMEFKLEAIGVTFAVDEKNLAQSLKALEEALKAKVDTLAKEKIDWDEKLRTANEKLEAATKELAILKTRCAEFEQLDKDVTAVFGEKATKEIMQQVKATADGYRQDLIHGTYGALKLGQLCQMIEKDKADEFQKRFEEMPLAELLKWREMYRETFNKRNPGHEILPDNIDAKMREHKTISEKSINWKDYVS